MNHDGIWGIYDETAFQKANTVFKKTKKPFIAVVLSLSSHLPFNLPSEKFDIFKNQQSPMREFLNSMSYSDYALRKFFNEAKKSDYFDNTLFIITGDRVAGYFTKESLKEAYRIPCLFYSKKLSLSGVRREAATQFDIMPTVMDLLSIESPFTTWGKSLFAGGERTAILPRGNTRVFLNDPYMLLTANSEILGLYNFREDPKKDLKEKDSQNASRLLEEMLLYINIGENRIINNKITPSDN